jgi:calcineurin-like phosphoesterase
MYVTKDGRRVLVVNLLGRINMDSLNDPFDAVERELAACPLGEACDALIVDMHAEVTSEKQAMGLFCDGRASILSGTHTHTPTADARILPGGTAYITDLGMCGDYDSVLGMEKEEPLRRFTTRIRGGRFEPSEGEGTLCGLFVETDDRTGLAKSCAPIRLGGVLEQARPTI